MPETTNAQNIELPKSIVLGGITYTVKDNPELQKFIQDVAKVEKSKLYSTYESIKAEIENLKAAKESGISPDSNKELIDELKNRFLTKEDLTEKLPGIIREIVQPILDTNERNRLDDLKQYREDLIKKNEATCIPDLVKGDTKEEIDKSLAESIRLRAKYPTPTQAGASKQVDPLIQAQAREAAKAVSVPSAPNRPSMDANNQVGDVKKMSMSEFASRRDALKEQLAAIYG